MFQPITPHLIYCQFTQPLASSKLTRFDAGRVLLPLMLLLSLFYFLTFFMGESPPAVVVLFILFLPLTGEPVFAFLLTLTGETSMSAGSFPPRFVGD
jgi:hypothetical protein